MTEWTDVSPGSTGYREELKGQLYSGFRGIYAGALTVRVSGTDIALYAGYIGAATTWTDVSPDSTVWIDV